ncbi:thiolase-like protein [Pisolithus orientalis]|uniref:thiolase-like protein n=1 Tax=Pisolithus orientalis TaxID=936130 RepID=UPI002224D0A2|nr:thiolase-like protein [Pisolithus orientalis]KAI5991290.1 thiolase-like protein [Pisolithus orientalis]
MTSTKGRRTFIVGCGCTAFIKMGLEAATKALLDAGITYDLIETAFVGHCYGDSTSGQRSLYNLGMTGIPITNVNNNCATGGTALYQVNNCVKSGLVECALALGFERMAPGSLGTHFPDRPSPLAPFHNKTQELEQGMMAGTNFGPASKNHAHSMNNPYSQFRNGWTVQQVLDSPKITKQLTKFMCSPTSDGAACCIVASEAFVHAHKLENQAIEDYDPTSFESNSAMEVVGYSMTRRCADKVFVQGGFAPGKGRDEIGVLELHDCFAANELIMYPALGLCAPDAAHKMVDNGDNTYGGKYVVNPSGGLEAKGHPLGATGIGMNFYITRAGPMQAKALFNTLDKRGKYGLTHNIGIGGAVVVSLLRRPEFYTAGGIDGRSRLGYNHGHECRSIILADVEKVKSTKWSPYVLGRAKL